MSTATTQPQPAAPALRRYGLEIRNASGANDSRHDRHYVDGKPVPYERFAAIRSAAMAANTWASLGLSCCGAFLTVLTCQPVVALL